uniref:Uncharacterized protein n=1 Tax=Heterorhabditis bacteriophora TaxID=37862 RepID=A0A1I7WEI8_HETBA
MQIFLKFCDYSDIVFYNRVRVPPTWVQLKKVHKYRQYTIIVGSRRMKRIDWDMKLGSKNWKRIIEIILGKGSQKLHM